VAGINFTLALDLHGKLWGFHYLLWIYVVEDIPILSNYLMDLFG
jgi:hypothetical protein